MILRPRFARFLMATCVASAGLAPASSARADVVDECIAAAVSGQKFEREGRLLLARDRFARCARLECPANVVQDCTGWTARLDETLPSVVLAATDGHGNDLDGVEVSIDGETRPGAISGQALPLDPGSHTVRFVRRGRDPIELAFVLREGEKRRRVTATFLAEAAGRGRPSPSPSRPVPTSVYVAGGASALALVGSIAFGSIAWRDYVSSGCSEGCDENAASRVRLEQRITDVLLITSVVGAAIATWLFLSRPVPSAAAAPGLLR